MNQNEPINENLNKDDILSFILPKNLECDVCVHVYHEFEKSFPNLDLKMVENNMFLCYLENQKICTIIVNVNEKYNISIKYNSNMYTIRNLANITEFAKYFSKYFENLQKLYTHIKTNYFIVNENDLSAIYIYDNVEYFCCEAVRKIKYRFDCDATQYFIFENGNKKPFKSLDEMDGFSDLMSYKNKCKLYCCC